MELVGEGIYDGVFEVFDNLNNFGGGFFIECKGLEESLDEGLDEFADFAFHGPLLVEDPLLIALEGNLFLFELFEFCIVDFVDIFEFVFEVFIFLFHFGN